MPILGNRGGSGGGSASPARHPTGFRYDALTGEYVIDLADGASLRLDASHIRPTVATEAALLALPDDIGQQRLVTVTGDLWQQVLSPPTDIDSWRNVGTANGFDLVDDAGGTFVDEAGNRFRVVLS